MTDVVERGLEGVVAKPLPSLYRPRGAKLDQDEEPALPAPSFGAATFTV